MRDQGNGRILSIGSSAGKTGGSGRMAAYAALMLTSELADYIPGEVTDVNGVWLID